MEIGGKRKITGKRNIERKGEKAEMEIEEKGKFGENGNMEKTKMEIAEIGEEITKIVGEIEFRGKKLKVRKMENLGETGKPVKIGSIGGQIPDDTPNNKKRKKPRLSNWRRKKLKQQHTQLPHTQLPHNLQQKQQQQQKKQQQPSPHPFVDIQRHKIFYMRV